MKITINKEELIDYLNKKLNIKSAAFDNDGNVIIDTVMEDFVDDKNNFNPLGRLEKSKLYPTKNPWNDIYTTQLSKGLINISPNTNGHTLTYKNIKNKLLWDKK